MGGGFGGGNEVSYKDGQFKNARPFYTLEIPVHLYVIRHGESIINVAPPNSIPRTELDTGLTELGRKQARAVAKWLPVHVPEIHALYASTMKRARETAQFIAAVYPHVITLDDRLREIGNNHLDTTPIPNHALPDKYSDVSPYHFPFSPVSPVVERSETSLHFRARVGLFLDEIIQKHEKQTVLVVAHGGVVNAIADSVFNVGTYRRCDIQVFNTGITHFEYRGNHGWETWRVYYMSRVDHLVGLEF